MLRRATRTPWLRLRFPRSGTGGERVQPLNPDHRTALAGRDHRHTAAHRRERQRLLGERRVQSLRPREEQAETAWLPTERVSSCGPRPRMRVQRHPPRPPRHSQSRARTSAARRGRARLRHSPQSMPVRREDRPPIASAGPVPSPGTCSPCGRARAGSTAAAT